MKLIIDSELSEPPSEVTCFRDVTLYAKVFAFEDVLLRCRPGTRSIYWKWLKMNGAHDYISYLLLDNEQELGYSISIKNGNINVPKIDHNNLSFIIKCIRSL